MRYGLAVIAAMTALGGCSMGADMKATDESVAQFHRLFNAGDYAGIQAIAGPELKGDPRMWSVYDLMDRKLGKFVSAERTGFNDSLTTAGHIMTVGYATKFTKGVGDETFTFRIGPDGKPSLVGYNINSPLFYDLRQAPSPRPVIASPTPSPSPSPSR